MRIAFARTGTVLFADNKDASPIAGNQDALGVLRYLKQSGHDVCVFGPAKGDFGVPVFTDGFEDCPYLLYQPGVLKDGAERPTAPIDDTYPSTDRSYDDRIAWIPRLFNSEKYMAEWLGKKDYPPEQLIIRRLATPKEEFVFRARKIVAGLRSWGPDVIVNVAGQQPSHSNPVNPWGTRPLRTAITTNFPCLLACEDLQLPRIVIINDPRNLPREHEAHYMSYTLPRAVLSQRSKVSYWETRGKKMRREEVYAGCENWWSYDVPYAPLDNERHGVVVMAHSHAEDARVYGPERAATWTKILANCTAPYDIYGNGWDGNPHHKGLITHDQVQVTLQRYACGPMIALEKGFATGKLREYVVAGCLPMPLTGSNHFTYDSDARYLPLDSPARIQLNDTWGEYYSRELVEELRVKSAPNFEPLEQAIAGKGEWGGYRWV